MLHLVITSCALMSCHIFSMQKQQPLPTLPKDMREYIFSFRETDRKEYKAYQQKCEWPSTISPQLVKEYRINETLERDLTNPISGESWDADKQKKILVNYWKAIRDLLVEPGDDTSVIFKTNGLHMFHAASPAIFVHLANLRDFKTDTIRVLLGRAFENLPTEYIGVSSPAF